jgi:hypothetical protein
MKKIRNFFRLSGEESEWENPRKSIGDPVGAVRDGKCTYWEAIGPAREAWKDLGPNVKNCIENSACEYGSALSVELYMFGSTKDNAVPQILVCSMEPKVRRQVLKAIDTIMHEYHPAITLGEISQLSDLLPVPLAQDDIESDIQPIASMRNETVVFTPPQDNPFGRRLFIPRQDTGSLRHATAGPILYINGKIYQLTVGHAFLNFGDFPLSRAQSTNLGQHNFDGQKPREDDNSELAVKSNSIIKGPWKNSDVCAEQQGSSSSSPESLSPVTGMGKPSLDSGVGLAEENASIAIYQFQGPIVPRKLDPLGEVALLSDTRNPKSPDYCLIKLKEAYRQGINEVPYRPNGSQRFLQVRRPAKDGPRDVNVITMTASSGFMSGRLCATASYVRFPNQRNLQELYPVRFDGNLVDGDCGSGVVDQSTGHMYGHIVAGTAGTGRAYIVSVEDVFRDIQGKMGGEVTLVPPGKILEYISEEKLKLSTLCKPDYSKRVEPLRVVEFASEEYFRKLKELEHSNSNGDKADISMPTTNSPTRRRQPNGRQVTGKSGERMIPGVQGLAQKQKSPIRSKLPHPNIGSLPQIAALESRLSTTNRDIKGKGKEKNNFGKRNSSKNVPFEEHFFALPSDLQVQVMAYLCVPDILNLQLASKNWHEFIWIHETPIARAFLEHNSVPHFAIDLYPLPAPPKLGLQYICELWHRLSVTSKMSTLMADWITTDIFLRKDEVQQLDFLPQKARIRRRLIPILFTIFHFFETYRRLHLKHLLENDHHLLVDGCRINPIERHIMNMYDNETLLQVHQVFPCLLRYLDRKLRPPSYFGRMERSFRGYVGGPPPEHVLVGILCIGGLREVARFLEIENYDIRRTAVYDWYASVSQGPIDSIPQACLWPTSLGGKPSKQTSFSTEDEDITNAAAAPKSVKPLSAQGDNRDDTQRTNYDKYQNRITLVPTIMPMPPLSAKRARLLLPDLPHLTQMWIPTSEALLLARQAVERRIDIKKNGQAMHELILADFTAADELFYGRNEQELIEGNVRTGWGDLLDDHRGDEITRSVGGSILDTSSDAK